MRTLGRNDNGTNRKVDALGHGCSSHEAVQCACRNRIFDAETDFRWQRSVVVGNTLSHALVKRMFSPEAILYEVE
jgi:hypothetical protein